MTNKKFEFYAVYLLDTLTFDLSWYSDDRVDYQEVAPGGKIYFISNYDTAYNPTLFDSANKHKLYKAAYPGTPKSNHDSNKMDSCPDI